MVLLWIILATVLVGVIAFAGAFTLILKEKTLKKILYILVAFSAGTLLGGAMLHLIVESLVTLTSITVFSIVITGFCVFFLMERFLFWHHCHEGICEVHPYTSLILIGDGIHNFIDGLIIAASFLINPALGVITTLIIISHEIPQELSDFGVLVYGGLGKRRALCYNFLSQLMAVAGGVVGFLIAGAWDFVVLLPFAAGGFIYIAASDLIPELHKEVSKNKSILSFIFFIIGILFMAAIKLFAGI
jgi:zinc and cadmium transporter